MKNMVVLVTGATSGIGESISYYLSNQGAKVVLVGRNIEKLRQMVSEIGENSCYFQYDLLDLYHIEEIFKYVKDRGWKLNGLVHCAGIAHNVPIKSNDITIMEETMKVNCFSFFELGKFFSLKKYSEEYSSIVAISSIITQRNDKALSQYAASKSALNSVVITMSKEFVKRKIRVNAIMPGGVKTSLFEGNEEEIDGFIDHFLNLQPYGLIDPLQIAYLTEFLLSDKAVYITGSLIPVTAGLDCRNL